MDKLSVWHWNTDRMLQTQPITSKRGNFYNINQINNYISTCNKKNKNMCFYCKLLVNSYLWIRVGFRWRTTNFLMGDLRFMYWYWTCKSCGMLWTNYILKNMALYSRRLESSSSLVSQTSSGLPEFETKVLLTTAVFS
jgi:hypothetical protein